MAATDFAALDTTRKKVWGAEIWVAGRNQNFWMSQGFVGTGATSVVQRITDLTPTERGDECIMQLVADLQGDGVVGDNLLEGNEEPMFNDSISLLIDQIRHGTRSKGRMSEQRTVIKFRSTSKDKLSFWIADKMDELLFLTASGVSYQYKNDGSTRTNSQLPSLKFAAQVQPPSNGRVMYANTATSTASLSATDKFTYNMIVLGNARAQRKLIKPIRASGKEYYAWLISTEQMRDLKTDPNYQTIVSRAGTRGDDNPLFKGNATVIDGSIIFTHNRVQNTQGLTSGSKWGAGGLVDGAQALLLGAQALGLATLNDVDYEESDNTDYKNRPGIGIGRMIGMVKPQFASPSDGNTKQDFGILSLFTAAGATS